MTAALNPQEAKKETFDMSSGAAGLVVDRYTKLMLTVIALTLLFMASRGSDRAGVVHANSDSCYIAGWVDEAGVRYGLSRRAGVPVSQVGTAFSPASRAR
jgi:hypothetical protein